MINNNISLTEDQQAVISRISNINIELLDDRRPQIAMISIIQERCQCQGIPRNAKKRGCNGKWNINTPYAGKIVEIDYYCIWLNDTE